MDNPSTLLQVAIDGAKKGASVALSFYKEKLNISKKEDNSLVTQADIATENAIKEYISSFYPEAVFILEESENTENMDDDIWIIDPIDGTREFVRGIDSWGILVAHVKKGEVVIGVAYSPVRDELISSEKGKGAFLNSKKISVSEIKNKADALVSISSIGYATNEERKKILAIADNFGSMRGTGTVFGGSCVATSKMDVFIAGHHNRIWDNAPFILIVPEAGGKVSDWEGKPIDIKKVDSSIIMSNGLLHDEVVKILNT